MGSKTKAQNRLKLQLPYYDSTLPTRLADDISRSSFSTRPKYLNALIEKVLSLPMRTATSSHIDEFFAWIDLFESLPTERIQQLAPTRNRSFEQMVKHLLEVALSGYPETSQVLPEARDARSHEAEVHQLRLLECSRQHDTGYQPPTVHSRSL